MAEGFTTAKATSILLDHIGESVYIGGKGLTVHGYVYPYTWEKLLGV